MHLIHHRRMFLILPLLTGCAASRVSPIGPGHRFVPDERESRLLETGQRMSADLQASGLLSRDPGLQPYLQSVLDRLVGSHRADYAPLKLRVFVLDSPTVNAFALPNGDIFVHSGLLGRMRNEAQLATVLGHELAHATHRHSYRRLEHAYDSTRAGAYIGVLSAAGGGNIFNAVNSLGGLLVLAAISGYGRENEREADQVGLELVASAGYDPAEASRMFQQMLNATDKKDRRYNFFYSTHPRMKERVEDAHELAAHLRAEARDKARERGLDRYLDVCGPLIFEEIELYIARGRYDLAEEGIQFLLDARPSARVHVARGDLLRARAGPDDARGAREQYELALGKDRSCPEAHRGMGLLLASAGDRAKAIEHLRTYLDAAGTAPDVPYLRSLAEQLAKGR